MPKLTIDVENRSFVKQGEGPIESAFGIEFDDPLSAAGTFSFSVPKADLRHSLLTVKSSIVRIYEDDTQVFLGIVEAIQTVIAADGISAIRVGGRNMAAALDESSVGFLEIKNGTSARSDAPDLIMAFASGWGVTGGNATSETVYGRYAGESVLAALDLVRERTGDNWRLSADDDRTVEWLTTFTDSGIRGESEGGESVALEGNPDIFLITGLSVEEDGFELVNRIYPYGAGHSAQGSGLTLAPSTYNGVTGDFNVTRASNYITYAPAGYSYPTIVKYMEFKDIEPLSGTTADLQSAANMLAEATFRTLERYGVPQVTYNLDAVKVPKSLRPGMTVGVTYYREDADGNVIHDIDETLNVLNIRTRYSDDGTPSYSLVVATNDRLPMADDSWIAGQLARGTIFQMHRQLSANSYRAPYRVYVGEDQADEKGDIRFLFDSETVQVQQVLFRFKIERLVAPTNTVGGTVIAGTTGGGGGESVTSGASSTTTTAGGSSHSHTVTISGHQHQINVNPNVNAGYPDVKLNTLAQSFEHTDASGAYTVTTNATTGTTVPTSSSESTHTHGMEHTHAVTTTDHTHSVSIDVGSALSTSFGIFLADLADTLDIDDLEYQINSNGWVALNTSTVLGSSYYEIDVTDDVINTTTLRPLSDNNLLEIRRASAGATGKTCMIDGFLKVREIIQS